MSTWEAVARQTYICMAKDHKDCDQTVCTPDHYPLHWMDEAEIALMLKLADHLNGSHTDGVKRPKTGPEAEEPPAPKPEPDKGDPGEGADKSADGEADQDSDGATVSPEDQPGDDTGEGSSGEDEGKRADELAKQAADKRAKDLADLAKAMKEAMLEGEGDIEAEPSGKSDPNPTGDGVGKTDSYVMSKGEKHTYAAHIPTVSRVIERDPRSGRDRTLYEGSCSCGYSTSPTNFRSLGGAQAAVNEHARSAK